MSTNPRIGELSARRSELRSAGRFREAIPLQLELIELLESEKAPADRLAMAHNMASVLYLRAKLGSCAEWHARRALEIPTGDSVKDHEARGTYYLVLAQIVATRCDFEAAHPFGEKAIAEFARFHNPPDEFLARVIGEVQSMKDRTWVQGE